MKIHIFHKHRSNNWHCEENHHFHEDSDNIHNKDQNLMSAQIGRKLGAETSEFPRNCCHNNTGNLQAEHSLATH